MRIKRLVKSGLASLVLIGLALPSIALATECITVDSLYTTKCLKKCDGSYPQYLPYGDLICINASPVNVKCCGKLKKTVIAVGGTSAANATVASPKIKSLIKTTPENFIARIIRNLLGLAGTMTMVMMVYGGLLWMTARGNTKTVGQAQKIIIWTAVGLVIIFSSYTILSFLFNNLK
ncbi:MAG TPA: pilin [bacterium]|nr:pilin [bacterium]